MSAKIEKILIDLKGKQIPWFPKKTDQIRIPFQKDAKVGDKIVFDKIAQKDEEFGQPYLKKVKVVGEVAGRGENKKIFGMKYKAKKRTKVFWGHQESYTKIKSLVLKEE